MSRSRHIEDILRRAAVRASGFGVIIGIVNHDALFASCFAVVAIFLMALATYLLR